MIISFVWTSIAFVAVAVALYILQRSYYRTSVQLRTLELEAMSRFTKHHMETLAHLPTTRAFGCVRENLSLGEKLIERSQLPAYYLAIVQTALKFTIELIVAGLATMVALFAVMQGGGQGLAGLALTQVMSLTLMKQGCVLSWAQLGTSMSALGRVKAFVEQVPPDRLNVQIADPPSDWPSRGKIELQSVTACYEYVHTSNGYFMNAADTCSTSQAPVQRWRTLRSQSKQGKRLVFVVEPEG
jgi:ABC-type multidrug transport system fused ATPase/permease subunit